MSIKTLETLLTDHPFFAEFRPEDLTLIAGCGANVKFAAGESVFREGEPANHFYLLRYGRVAVEVFSPGKGPVTIQTLHEGEVLGWSWLVPPYRWRHDARALELTRAFSFDGTCLRRKCDEDPPLGYRLMRRFSQVIAERLGNAQMQLMDLYGPEDQGA
ncbi:MAG: cyclic nucleotide-binding domain-containing protein [Acidobacteriota bacterium]